MQTESLVAMYINTMITDIPKKDPERWAYIKCLIEMKGYSLASLAKKYGLSGTTLAQAKNKSYPNCEKIIADTLELLPQMIWPERYGKDGHPAKHSARYPRKGIKRPGRKQRISQKEDLPCSNRIPSKSL